MSKEKITDYKTYSYITVIAIIINYAVGTGILNLPHVFADASIFTSIIISLLVSCSTYLLARFTLDVVGRTFALERKNIFSTQDVLQEGSTLFESDIPDFSLPNSKLYQVSELCKLYYGQIGFVTYQIAIAIYFFGTIWGYGQVVASSLTSAIPMTFLGGGDVWQCNDTSSYSSACNGAYYIWMSIICIFCVIMVFFDLTEQKVLQQIFTVCRFLLLFIVICLIIYCISSFPFQQQQSFNSNVNPSVKYFEFNPQSVGALFSSVAFSQVSHHSLPAIFQPTKQEDQKKLNAAISYSFAFLTLITFAVALPGALYFGGSGTDLVTLNFGRWSGGAFDGQKGNWFVETLKYLVLLLPPVYVLTCIPINCLTLANNLKALLPEAHRGLRWVRVCFNLASVLPALAFSFAFKNLGFIISFTGLAGFVILVTPAVLLLRARRMCYDTFLTKKSQFSGFLDHDAVCYFIFAFYAAGFVLTLWSLIGGMIGE